MKKNTKETHLPQQLDLSLAPAANHKAIENLELFLEEARSVIGYPVEMVYQGILFAELTRPIFNASLIDYEYLPYAEYLSHVYNFYRQRNRLFEAQETLYEFQELVLNRYSYVLLSLNIAGYFETLHKLNLFLEMVAKEYGMVHSTKKIKFSQDLPVTVAPYIEEPHLLKSTFIFSDST